VVKGEKKGHWSGWIKVGLDSFYRFRQAQLYPLCAKLVKSLVLIG